MVDSRERRQRVCFSFSLALALALTIGRGWTSRIGGSGSGMHEGGGVFGTRDDKKKQCSFTSEPARLRKTRLYTFFFSSFPRRGRGTWNHNVQDGSVAMNYDEAKGVGGRRMVRDGRKG
ncbi:hypothetical protein EV126DRAFT_423591 [Verticillium dahliae]|nr:hypothetical protein EV126DRAFT_423591 [Verticillium dahliae]